MRDFQHRLFIVLAVGLCGLCAYQWYVQSLQRGEIETLAQIVSERNLALRNSTNTIQATDHQVTQLDAELGALKATIKTNTQLIVTQQRELTRLRGMEEEQANRVAQYKQALNALTNKIKTAHDGIEAQNNAIAQLVAQRDEFVSKYNASVKERNEVVGKYNDLVKRLEQNQVPAKPGHPDAAEEKKSNS